MKKIAGKGLIILVLLLVAIGLGGYGYYQVVLARAQEHIDKLEYAKAENVYQDFESRCGRWLRLPRVGEAVKKHLAWKKNELRYWQVKYAELVQQNAGNNFPVEFVRGNAFYRAVEKETNKQKVLDFLDSALQIYVAVIKGEPDSFDAVYNYEYLHRVRDEVANGKRPLPLKAAPGQNKEESGAKATPGDGRDGGRAGGKADIHGQPGSNPSISSQQGKINVHVPQTGEENSDKGPGIGKDNTKKKKG